MIETYLIFSQFLSIPVYGCNQMMNSNEGVEYCLVFFNATLLLLSVLVPISTTFFEQLSRAQIQKVQKRHWWLDYLLALLVYAHIKAAHKHVAEINRGQFYQPIRANRHKDKWTQLEFTLNSYNLCSTQCASMISVNLLTQSCLQDVDEIDPRMVTSKLVPWVRKVQLIQLIKSQW